MTIRRSVVFSVSSAVVMAFALAIGAQSFRDLHFRNLQDGPVAHEVMKINEELVSAEVRRDISVLNVLFADDYVHVHSNGWVESRADFLSDFESGKRVYHLLDLQNVHVQSYDKAALIIGISHVRSTSSGENKDNTSRFLAMWVPQQGAWRLALWVTTPLQDRRAPWAPTGGDR
jgi:hypothetical protein